MLDKAYYLGFSLVTGIGPARFAKLIEVFKTAENAWNADARLLKKVLGELITEHFVEFRKTINLEKELEKVEKKGVFIITLEDKDYPRVLRVCSDNTSTHPTSQDQRNEKNDSSVSELTGYKIPFLLYVKGNVDLLNYSPSIGIVGTRKITPYGKQVTEQLTRDLVSAGFVTVSGLALGVDAVVHSETMDSQGKTIAVLGCGVDCCYPRENQRIYDRILDRDGTIISTLPPGMQPNVGTFPARNAIIAGLSLGVVVTEGAADSGALITAKDAKKIGRSVFAVPGPITSGLSTGPNVLLQQGAILVTSGKDVIRALEFRHSIIAPLSRTPQNDEKRVKGDTPEEQKILDMIQLSPLHFDEIVRTIGKSPQEIGSVLSLMELKGLVKNNQGVYSKIT